MCLGFERGPSRGASSPRSPGPRAACLRREYFGNEEVTGRSEVDRDPFLLPIAIADRLWPVATAEFAVHDADRDRPLALRDLARRTSAGPLASRPPAAELVQLLAALAPDAP